MHMRRAAQGVAPPLNCGVRRMLRRYRTFVIIVACVALFPFVLEFLMWLTPDIGLIWLLLTIDFALVAWGAYAGAGWWPLAAVATALISLVVCLLTWPETKVGAFVDIGIVVVIVVWRAGLGFIDRG